MADTEKKQWLIQTTNSEECEYISGNFVIRATAKEAQDFCLAQARELAMKYVKDGSRLFGEPCIHQAKEHEISCVVQFRTFHCAVIATDVAKILSRTVIEDKGIEEYIDRVTREYGEASLLGRS